MISPSRRGSFLLICLGLMSMAIILSITFLRGMRIRSETGTSTRRVVFAQESARMGLRHALEAALKDNFSATIAVGSDLGTPTVDVPALQFLDGPYRAGFTAIEHPNSCWGFGGTDTNASDVDKDVRHEHLLTYPWLPWMDGDWGAMRFAWYAWEGSQHFSGRGRYFEPEFYNGTRQPTGTPLAAVSFLDRNPPVPEINNGLYFDEDFRRIDTGDAVRDRQAARYRLRYTIGIEDLNGHILTSPVGDFRDEATYRNPEPWLARAKDAFGGIMTHVDGEMGGATWEHIFLGRGWSTNCDIASNGFPSTFPLMYRSGDPNNASPPWSSFKRRWWDYNDTTAPNMIYASTKVTGNPAGGEELWANADVTMGVWPGECNHGRYIHAKLGPQRSWQSLFYSYIGSGSLRPPKLSHTMFTLTPYGRPLRKTIGYPGDYNPVERKWHEGRVDTPFYLNLLTAPPSVFRGMLNAYWPKAFKRTKFDRIIFQTYGGQDANNNAIFDPVVDGNGDQIVMAINPWDPANQWQGSRDLLVRTTHDAFSAWEPPRRDASSSPALTAGAPVEPDYYVADSRPLIEAYPGPLMNGDSANPNEGNDDLGALINASNNVADSTPGLMMLHNDWRGYFWKVGVDTHIGHWMWDKGLGGQWTYRASDLATYTPDANGDPVVSNQNPGPLTVTPPASWWNNPENRAIKLSRDTADSYCWDIAAAFMSAVNITRSQWIQYDNPQVLVGQLFDANKRNPQQHQTIRDLDRLFLAQLGESLESPGTGAPSTLGLNTFPAAWQDGSIGGRWVFRHQGNVASSQYAPQHNIRSLKDGDHLKTPGGATTADRAMVMELVLNDFRMSFMGSSPDYSDPVDPSTRVLNSANEFRPLDFDGDGQVKCSCYDNDSAAAEGDGRGPRPTAERYFSVTGNFFMGKSHYFRVWTRGEVWDNRTSRILNEATLQSVIAIDPEGLAYPDYTDYQPADHQVLHQRWIFDKYQGQLSRVKR